MKLDLFFPWPYHFYLQKSFDYDSFSKKIQMSHMDLKLIWR